ncbi:MAG: hypothetical protein KIT09_05915 [Bryobacteraceae bacterium]|nr:hypothetical protein [Bryobacteraceae bacterium]
MSAESARRTLQEIETLARSSSYDADVLTRMIENPSSSSDSQMSQLMNRKTEINKMGNDLAMLENERDTPTPWEREAVDKVHPLLKEAAEDTSNAIRHFDENRNFLWARQYRNNAKGVAHDSQRIASTLGDYLKYEKLRDREARIESEMPEIAKTN